MMKKKLRLFCVSTERAMILVKCFVKYCKSEKRSFFLKIKKMVIRNYLHKNYNIIIGDDSKIGKNILFPHPQNIIIGSKVRIGENCTIYHDVTIGQNRGKYPTIGNNVIIYPGAKVFGDIYVADFAIIGANSVVQRDIPPNAIFAGIPAKQIGIRSNNSEFY